MLNHAQPYKMTIRLVGGPYNKKTVALATPGTLPIRVGKWTGYYDRTGLWVDGGSKNAN